MNEVASFGKKSRNAETLSSESPEDNRIKTCENRVFEEKFGLHYDNNPNVMRTNSSSVYRIAGMNQIADN